MPIMRSAQKYKNKLVIHKKQVVIGRMSQWYLVCLPGVYLPHHVSAS